MEEQNPLSRLFVSDEQTLNQSSLSELVDYIGPYISIEANTGKILFTNNDFYKLPNDHKIVMVLLAVKARALYMEGFVDGIAPSELIKMEFAPSGSVKGTLKKLSDESVIRKHKDNGYFVPNYKVSSVVNID